jgi:hypothetical protein
MSQTAIVGVTLVFRAWCDSGRCYHGVPQSLQTDNVFGCDSRGSLTDHVHSRRGHVVHSSSGNCWHSDCS